MNIDGARRRARARHRLHLTRWLAAARAGASRRARREAALAVRALDLRRQEAPTLAQDARLDLFRYLDPATVALLVLVVLLGLGAVL